MAPTLSLDSQEMTAGLLLLDCNIFPFKLLFISDRVIKQAFVYLTEI